MTGVSDGPLKILHVLRAPVGGLFRHVADLARGQAARGHAVGLVADATTGGPRGEALLAELRPSLKLGLSRVEMSRHIGLGDLKAASFVGRHAADLAVDVLHGHGAKGGAFARLAGTPNAIRVYTPHGGSLHYGWNSTGGLLYLSLERLLMHRTDLFLFESAFGLTAFTAKVGNPQPRRVIHNGVNPSEFEPVGSDPGATDLLFVGELRHLKGVDVLIEAIAQLADAGQPLTATIVGEGPDRPAFEAMTAARHLGDRVRFAGAMSARAAFRLGHLLIIPSRAESLPYIVLEAAAAGRPMVATRVGGIPEIFGPEATELIAPSNVSALAHAIAQARKDPEAMREAAARLRDRVRAEFSTDVMTESVLAAYRDVVKSKGG